MITGMIIFGGVILVIVWTYISFVEKYRCEKCNRKKAMKKTGVWRSHPYSKFAINQYEQLCEYCGHIRWRNMVEGNDADSF